MGIVVRRHSESRKALPSDKVGTIDTQTLTNKTTDAASKHVQTPHHSASRHKL
jgi:hypothetical protein